MTKENTKIVKAPPMTTALTKVPEYLKTAVPDGFENMNQGDMVVPRLALCQSMTPHRKKNNPKFIAGLEEGHFFNTVTGRNYGPTVTVIPLTFHKSRIRFKDMDDGGGILCQALDARTGVGDPGGDCARCPLSQFGSAMKGKGKACTEFFNYPSLVVPKDRPVSREDLVINSFKSTAIGEAKKMNSIARLSGVDMYGWVYEITSAPKTQDDKEWFIPIVSPKQFVSQEVHELAKKVKQAVADLNASGRLRADYSDMEREPGSDDVPEQPQPQQRGKKKTPF